MPALQLAEVFATLRAFADSHYQGCYKTVAVVLELQDGQRVLIPVPACRGEHDDALNALERDVVAVVDGLGVDETITGEQLATRSGYPYHGRLKDTLARLVRQGRIRNRNPGYARNV